MEAESPVIFGHIFSSDIDIMALKRPAKSDGGPSSGKIKGIALTICQKVELLKKLERGVSVRKVSEQCDVRSSTIYDLKKQKAQIF